MYNSMRSRVIDEIQASSIVIEWNGVDHAKQTYAKMGAKRKIPQMWITSKIIRSNYKEICKNPKKALVNTSWIYSDKDDLRILSSIVNFFVVSVRVNSRVTVLSEVNNFQKAR